MSNAREMAEKNGDERRSEDDCGSTVERGITIAGCRAYACVDIKKGNGGCEFLFLFLCDFYEL